MGMRAFLLIAVMLGLCGCQQGYVFEPEDIHALAQEASGLPIEEAVDHIHATLQERYPGEFREEMIWHFNRTAGTLGQMAILYASLNEYVLIFGTPIGSEGFSGRYADMIVYDCMFAGEMRTYTEGQLAPTVYLPGDVAILEAGQGKGYNMTGGTWMLEYTRGNIPAALPIGVFAPVSVTADWQNAGSVLWDYATLVFSSFF